ncbi:MAG: 8-oxo-dGTP diphosphatase [Candidatus Nealsonbacteria bacterium]
MKEATICLLIKGSKEYRQILLAMKKRGFGAGKWNGVGGKIDFEKGDKNIVDAAIRETEEEIGVHVNELEKVALLNFTFPYNSAWDQTVHVFFAKNWEKEPAESEEMAPKWFKVSEIPYDKMWADDKFWLPKILEGKKLKADFIFKEGEVLSSQNIEIT